MYGHIDIDDEIDALAQPEEELKPHTMRFVDDAIARLSQRNIIDILTLTGPTGVITTALQAALDRRAGFNIADSGSLH